MKLGTCVLFGAAGFGSLLLATSLSVEGCSSSNSTTPPADGGGTSTAGNGLPPAKPTSGTTAATTNDQNFALQKLHLGDEKTTRRNARLAAPYGYNLDGLATKTGDMNVCKPVSGASPTSQVDGPNGIDNSFRREHPPPPHDGWSRTPARRSDMSIVAGKFTLMLDVDRLSTPRARRTAPASAANCSAYALLLQPGPQLPGHGHAHVHDVGQLAALGHVPRRRSPGHDRAGDGPHAAGRLERHLQERLHRQRRVRERREDHRDALPHRARGPLHAGGERGPSHVQPLGGQHGLGRHHRRRPQRARPA